MKIKIIIAILAAALIAYAGSARAQIIIVPGPAYSTLEECIDAEEAALRAKAEAIGIPKFKSLKGMIVATMSTNATLYCEGLFGIEQVCPLGLQTVTQGVVKEALSAGTFIDSYFMGLFNKLWDNCGIVAPPPACDYCSEPICYDAMQVQVDCSKIDPCGPIKWSCDQVVLPKECDRSTCAVQCPFCNEPSEECTYCNCNGTKDLCGVMGMCTGDFCAIDGDPVVGCTLGGQIPKYCP